MLTELRRGTQGLGLRGQDCEQPMRSANPAAECGADVERIVRGCRQLQGARPDGDVQGWPARQ